MLIVDGGDCVINVDNTKWIHIDSYNRDAAYLKFDDCAFKFGSRAEAQFTLTDIVEAYEQGRKVYRIVRGRTA